MIFVFSGCIIPQQPQGIIEGRVLIPPAAGEMSKDVSGWVPAPGAEVTVVDANGVIHTVTTDENGYYSFENISVNPNTVITATVEVEGKTIVLKKVIPDAVAEDENYDAGTMTPEATALALVVEKLIDEGVEPEDIYLGEILAADSFEDLVENVTTAIEEKKDVTEDPNVTDGVGEVAEEILYPDDIPPSNGGGGNGGTTPDPTLPATLSPVELDEEIAGTPGYTRFEHNIVVDKSVEEGEYEVIYVLEIVEGEIEGSLQASERGKDWIDLEYEENNKITSPPKDLFKIDLYELNFQAKITGESITYKAYLVDTDDDTKVLSNVLEETIVADPEKGIYNRNTEKYFEEIHAAINDDATSNGDEIIVYPGEYDEEIIIDKAITLAGDGIDSSIIKGSIIIEQEGVEISGFTITSALDGDVRGIVSPFSRNTEILRSLGDFGILLNFVDECTIKDNKIIGINGPGIVLALSNNNKIIDNYIEDNESWGLALAGAWGNDIEGNYFSGNVADTIALDNASAIGGVKERGSNNNTFDGNTIEGGGNCGFYLGENCGTNTITNNTISAVNASDDAIAIFLHFADGNEVTGNIITGNSNGIKIRSSSSNNIKENTVTNNTVMGIEISCAPQSVTSQVNSVKDNIIMGNAFGLDAGDNNGTDVDESPTVDASFNWWGNASGPEHSSNTDGIGDEVSDYVDFSPWYINEEMTDIKYSN